MKKLFIILSISTLGFVACNNSANNNNTEDSTELSADSSATSPSLEAPPVNPSDTVVNLDTTAEVTDSAVH